MTTIELLKDYLDRERNNVLCYSASYLMDSPKKGYEREFAETLERVELLEQLIMSLAEPEVDHV